MNLLLDTHVFLWAVDNPSNLSKKAHDAIVEGSNVVFVSAATAWEISIKKGLGKLKIPDGDYLEELRIHRFTPLDITTEHALKVETLESIHSDPFDRMLIAQALSEKLVIVTRDHKFKDYPVNVIKA